jgi:hypothetical protein
LSPTGRAALIAEHERNWSRTVARIAKIKAAKNKGKFIPWNMTESERNELEQKLDASVEHDPKLKK